MLKDKYENAINPSQKQKLLHRPRLDDLLNDAVKHNLIKITAGAGYGKTQAVSMYLNSKDFHVMWVQLSKLDNLPLKFWNKFINAISYKNRQASKLLELFGFPDTLTRFDGFLRIFAEQIYAGEKYILVLDDLHLIHNKSVIDFIDNIIYAELENFCLILISRAKPDLDLLHILNSESEVYIEQNDLLFTLSETREYLQNNGLELSESVIKKIYVHTAGWPLAIYLVGLSAQKGNIISENPLVDAVPYLFELIDKELFSNYSDEIQHLLIQLSFLNEFSAGLVKMLTGNKFETIMKVLTTNMCINYNIYDQNYHPHGLFLDFLKEKRAYLEEEEIYQTYLKTADWYLKNNKKFDAYVYYEKCGRYDRILDVMENYGPAVFPKENADFLINLIEKFPKDFVKEHPIVNFLHAGLLINNDELQPAVKELYETEEYLKTLPPSDKNKTVLGEIYMELCMTSFAQRSYDMKDYIKKACELLPNGSNYVDSTGRILNTKNAIMMNSTSQGALYKMEEVLFETIPYVSKVMNGCATGFDYLASAEAAYFTGDMNKAQKNAYEAIYRAREYAIDDIVSSGYFLLTRIYFMRGSYKNAVASLNQLKDFINSLECGKALQYMIDIANSWFYIMIDQTDKVSDWIMDDIQSNKMIAPYSIGTERLVRANCYLKQGRYYELLAWVEKYVKPMHQQNRLLVLLEILIHKAIAYYHIDEKSQAFTTLQAAYDLAHENNLIMQFVEYGNDMRSLTNAAKREKGHYIPQKWLENIYSKSTTYEKRLAFIKTKYNAENCSGSTILIRLTNREIEVLTDLSQGLTRDEIASNLSISVNTVKSILQNIYSKLGAVNSADAVRIAIKRNII